MKLLKKISFIILVFLLFSCSKKNNIANNKKDIIKVQALKIKKQLVNDYYSAPGTVHSTKEALLASKVIGYIKEIKAEENSFVKKDDILLQIDDTEIKSNLEMAQSKKREAEKGLEEVESGIKQLLANKQAVAANFLLAEKTYNRFKNLLKQQAVSQQEFDKVETNYEVAKSKLTALEEQAKQLELKKSQIKEQINQAQSNIENAKNMLNYTMIKAPFSGLIVKKFVEVGDLVSPGKPMLKIEDNSSFELWVNIPETYLKLVRPGKRPKIELQDNPDLLEGEVLTYIPSSEPMSHTATVKIKIPQGLKTHSGIFGRAYCSAGTKEAIVLNINLIIKRGQLEFIYTVGEDNTLKLTLIKTGKTYLDKAEILSGLEEGDVVVTSKVNPEDIGKIVELIKE